MFWEKFIQDLPFYLLNLLAFSAVVAVTWLWARTRFFAELAQYQTQIAELQLQRNDQLFALEDECKAKAERLRLILKDLRNQISFKKADMVNARRNELSNVFILEYCPTMQQYTRLAAEMFEYDYKKRRQFLENHILPFLQLSGDLLKIINQPNAIEMIGEEAIPIRWNYMDFDFAFDFIRTRIKRTDLDARTRMHKHLKRLGFQKDIKMLS